MNDLLILLLSAVFFIYFQQMIFKILSSKFHQLPLLIALILALVGLFGSLITRGKEGMDGYGALLGSGFGGILVCPAMLVAYKTNLKNGQKS